MECECIKIAQGKHKIDEFARRLVAENYSDRREIVSYGFIIVPPNTEKS